MQVSGKVAVITGGVSGLGRGTAELFVREGAKVVLFDLDETLGSRAVEELGANNALFVKTDVTGERSVREGVAAAVARFGAVHININCAGVGGTGKTLGKSGPLPFEAFYRMVNINLNGTLNVMRLCAGQMSRQDAVGEDEEHGVILNTASVAAFEGQAGQAAYSASKCGVVAMTLPAARDLAAYGIRVMCIAPGIIDTPMLQTVVGDGARQALIATVQFPKRLVRPQDYANTARDIVRNRYLNGEVIRLDAALRMAARS